MVNEKIVEVEESCEKEECPEIKSLDEIAEDDRYCETENNKVVYDDDSVKAYCKVNNVEKLPPWAIRYNELVALFGEDEDLVISPVDDKTRSCDILSWNYHKLKALSEILKDDEFLNITFTYLGEDNAYMQTLIDALDGNPHLNDIRLATDAATGKKLVIVAFKDETIQYPADNRFVPGGYETTLAEKIIKDLFKRDYRRNPYITAKKTEPECCCTPCDECPHCTEVEF